MIGLDLHRKEIYYIFWLLGSTIFVSTLVSILCTDRGIISSSLFFFFFSFLFASLHAWVVVSSLVFVVRLVSINRTLYSFTDERNILMIKLTWSSHLSDVIACQLLRSWHVCIHYQKLKTRHEQGCLLSWFEILSYTQNRSLMLFANWSKSFKILTVKNKETVRKT